MRLPQPQSEEEQISLSGHQQPDEPEGAATKRTTMLTTGLSGVGGTLIALGTHGPAGLFFGVLGTAAALALEGHGTPEEYAALARSVGPLVRWIARRRHTEAAPYDLRPSVWEVTEPLRERWATGEMPSPQDFPPRPRRNILAQEQGLPPDSVQLAPDLALPIGEIAGKAIFIVGMRRSGKTTLGVRIAEELAGHYLPLFWPDLEGDCLSMVDMLPRGRVAGHPSSYDPTSEYAYAFEPVTVESAYLLGYTILEDGWQVVLDMASYQSVDEAVQVTVQVIAGLFAWVAEHPKERVPCHVALDEAQRFLPERLSDSIIQDKATLDALLKAYMDIIAVGGKRGIAPLILTQRFAQVNKKIMAQSELFFILRQTMDKDLERCMEFVKKRTATEEEISQFQPGEGVYIGPGGEQFVTRFFQRHSDGSRSHTPQAEAARRYEGLPMRKGIGKGPQQPPEEPPPQGAAVPRPPQPPKGGPSLLERGVEAYLDGATSQPKLAAALGISAWEARTLMPQVQAEVKRREDIQADEE